MASNYAQALADARDIIEALVPEDEPTTSYRRVPRGMDIRTMPLLDMPSRHTRQFQVSGEVDPDPSEWNGTTAEVRQSFTLRVLYDIPSGPDTGGWDRLTELAGADAAALAHQLNIPSLGVGFDQAVRNCEHLGGTLLRRSDDEPDVWILEQRYQLTYGIEA